VDTDVPLENEDTIEKVDTLVPLEKVDTIENEDIFDNCNIKKIILSGNWKINFPGVIELEYLNNTNLCSYQLLLKIINFDNPTSGITNINLLKEILIEEYKKLSDKKYNIYNILLSQGKKTLSSKLLLGTISIDNAIMSENYYITNLDIMLIAKRFNLPIIFVSSSSIVENKKKILILNYSERHMYYFIKLPSFKGVNVPRHYRIFVKGNNMLIDTNSLLKSYSDDIRIAEEFNLLKYINSIKIPKVIKPKVIKPNVNKPNIIKPKVIKDDKKEDNKKLIIKPKSV